MAAARLGGAFRIDPVMRRIPDHFHAHARDPALARVRLELLGGRLGRGGAGPGRPSRLNRPLTGYAAERNQTGDLWRPDHGGERLRARAGLDVGDRSLEVFRLDALASVGDVGGLPFSLKVLLENLLRNEDGGAVTAEDVEAFARWDPGAAEDREIAFSPARC